MALLDAIIYFVEAFNSGEKNSGTLTLLPRKQAVPDDLFRNGQLRYFYENVTVHEAATGNVFFIDLASLDKLPKYQEGWRWNYDDYPIAIEDTEYWRPSWLVFGERSEDAVFVKQEDEKSPVFGTIQKLKEFQLSTSLESFLKIMTACMNMVRDEFQYETQFEDYTTKPEVIKRTRQIVAEREGPEIVEQFIAFFFE